MSETDNFSHRAGYADDPLAVAIRYAKKGGTLAAGEGALLVKEIERLAECVRVETVLRLEIALKLDDAISRARKADQAMEALWGLTQKVGIDADGAVVHSLTAYWRAVIRDVVAAAEREVEP